MRQPLFFLCANRNTQILLTECNNRNAESPHAIVCWVWGRNRADTHANFGTKQTIERMWDANLHMNAVYRHISPARRIPVITGCTVLCGFYMLYTWYEGLCKGSHWQVMSHGGPHPPPTNSSN